MSNQPGTLYVVATPIGNMQELSPRAREILASVDLIAAEDTRHSARLLKHFGITTPMRSYHEFNERREADALVERMLAGMKIALISDAGTPLISDPGYRLVALAHERGVPVAAVPGPSAVMAALSVSGLPTDRFLYVGYVPERPGRRRAFLQELASEPATLVLLETPHRILDCLGDCIALLGAERTATIARELTKRFETVKHATLAELLDWLQESPSRQKGEFVLVIAGTGAPADMEKSAVEHVMEVLLRSHGARDASAIGSEITGWKKNDLYRMALRIGKANRH